MVSTQAISERSYQQIHRKRFLSLDLFLRHLVACKDVINLSNHSQQSADMKDKEIQENFLRLP